jgi:AbrB family looped-hinge helix DNA binding protein
MATNLKERVKVGYDGRITLSKTLRAPLGIKEGSFLELELYKDKILVTVLVK